MGSRKGRGGSWRHDNGKTVVNRSAFYALIVALVCNCIALGIFLSAAVEQVAAPSESPTSTASVEAYGPPVPSASPQVTEGTATWYGSTSGYKTHCYGGYRNTCTPYASGEQVWYAAVGSWHYHDKPYQVEVCRTGTAKCVTVTVRDYCHGAWKALKKPWKRNSRLIDLSPAAFMELAPLSRGIIYVTVRVLP